MLGRISEKSNIRPKPNPVVDPARLDVGVARVGLRDRLEERGLRARDRGLHLPG